jgi:hypothetical protein
LLSTHFAVITYRMESASELLAGWGDAMRAAPEAVTSSVLLSVERDGEQPLAVIRVRYAGSDSTAADIAFEPFLELGCVIRAVIEERPRVGSNA